MNRRGAALTTVRRLAVLAAALALAACGALKTRTPSPPAPEPAPSPAPPPPAPAEPGPALIRPPLPAKPSCVPKGLARAPKYPDTDQALREAGGAADRYQLMARGRLLRNQRLTELEKVVDGCR
jgi:hypothetical protein